MNEQHAAADFNIFEGFEVTGLPIHVVANGKVVVRNRQVNAVKGAGRFVPTDSYSPVVYQRVEQREQVCVVKGFL